MILYGLSCILGLDEAGARPARSTSVVALCDGAGLVSLQNSQEAKVKLLIPRAGFPLVLLGALALSCVSNNVDDEEFVDQLDEALCTAVSLTSSDADRIAVPGANILWTATPTCSGTPQYRFNLRSPTGVWTVAQDWSASSTYNWPTTGLPFGTYNMQLWVRDAAMPPTKFQKYVGVNFELRASEPCTAATMTVTPTSAAAGTNFTFTNTAATCTNATFAIYHKPPGGVFALLSAYSAANSTYVWNSTGKPLGAHVFQLWARSDGATVKSEAVAPSKTVTVSTSNPCSAANLTFAPVTHAPVGTAVALTASSATCIQPTYKYFHKAPGGNFAVLQDWTASQDVTWNTLLAPAGTHTFQVYARNSGSTVTYESFATKTYILDVATPTSAVSIGGGWENKCELLADGRVACWGYNANGQLGVGTTYVSAKTPVIVTGVAQAVSLGVGYAHSCAVLFDGTAKCWGRNDQGQLGNNSITAASTPVVVSGLTGVSQVAAGTGHSCALRPDGTVRCWGYNSQGQLGNGSVANSRVPVVTNGIIRATQLAIGYYHSCALLRDGTVRCWGYNANGQLGNGTTTNSLTPVAVSGLTGVTAISASSSNTCALKSDGTIWCWGANSADGSLGNGTTTRATSPVQVTGITTARSVAIGGYHGCAALQDGTARCWGLNTYGELGNASVVSSTTPVVVSGLANVTSIAVSTYASCATITGNAARCWGHGATGELGNGGVANSNVPVVVSAVPN